ncbi:pmpB, partial [Symbiodinium necroappetens]
MPSDCELVQWDDLCGHQLPVGRPQTASVCELLGPGNSEEPSLLLGNGFVTLQTEGSLRITGNLRVRSARFEAESIFLQDAQVETQQSAPNTSAQGGGTFHSKGALTLERSNITVTGGGARWGGGLAAGGDVALVEASLLKVAGSVAEQDGGGLYTAGTLRLRGGSQIIVEATSAARGGGFFASGE